MLAPGGLGLIGDFLMSFVCLIPIPIRFLRKNLQVHLAPAGKPFSYTTNSMLTCCSNQSREIIGHRGVFCVKICVVFDRRSRLEGSKQ